MLVVISVRRVVKSVAVDSRVRRASAAMSVRIWAKALRMYSSRPQAGVEAGELVG